MADNISFDDLIPSKQTDKSAPSKGADISFDDLIPKQAEARPSTTSVIEGKGGAAFGIYPKASTDQEPASRIATNIGRTATESIIPTGAGLAGFGGGMAAAMPVAAVVAPLTGPFAPVVAGAIQLAGGFGGDTKQQLMSSNNMASGSSTQYSSNNLSTLNRSEIYQRVL